MIGLFTRKKLTWKPTVCRIHGILKLPEFYLDDYKNGTYEDDGEVEEDGVKTKVKTTKSVREAVSTTALSEFSFVARDETNSDETVKEIWALVRCGKISTTGIREAAKEAKEADHEPENEAEAEADKEPDVQDEETVQAKTLKKSLKSIGKALTQLEGIPPERLKLSDLELLEKLSERIRAFVKPNAQA